ncbi:hypothetical protein MJO48_02855 [Dickeya fangzhongdai]|uniref:hypothetical protein n=1 Tax=Dickeya fangzhongdai TaxID=1778540 RepID=UPI001EFB4391|nr:hypothetical protein [Dickeya fangzhongdai]ULR31670.1 hypothetical protein MJO48_02855 [Dickeya fangzhongdai]
MTDLLSKDAVLSVCDLKAGYQLGHADVMLLKTIAGELLQRREAAEGKPYAYEFVTKGKLLGKVCLKRVLPPVDVIDVTPLWRQPPLNSAERERLATLERVVDGLPQDAIDGGWTAVGIIAYAKSLQSELAALRQAQQGPSTAANSTAMADNDLTAALCDLAYANGAGNSPVIPDVPAITDWKIAPMTASREMVKAGAAAAREYMMETGRNSPSVIYTAMIAEAPQPEHFRDGTKMVSLAVRDVIAERRRQITAEGWTPEHDNAYSGGELARAAACYAVMSVREEFLTEEEYAVTQKRLPFDWPWEPEWWKPTSSRRDLVKAGALILAEIERIDRCATQSKGGK